MFKWSQASKHNVKNRYKITKEFFFRRNDESWEIFKNMQIFFNKFRINPSFAFLSTEI
jgi:hypothetical protein